MSLNATHARLTIGRVLVSFLVMLLRLRTGRCLNVVPMPCNVSLTYACPAALYFVPKQLQTLEEAAALFRVPSNTINRTTDGFLIAISCSCPAGDENFVWHTAYTVRPGDTWRVVANRFGSLVEEEPEKQLLPSMNVTLDVLCGCVEGPQQLVTYTIQPGDTLYTICARFGADMEKTIKLNKVTDPSLIRVGDRIFIPATGLSNLIVHDEQDLNSRRTSKVQSHNVLIIAVAAVVVVLVMGALLFWFFLYNTKQRKPTGPFLRENRKLQFTHEAPVYASKNSLPDSHSLPKDYGGSTTSFRSLKTTVFPYSEICDATSNFSASQKVGQGSYGSVYRGSLRGAIVAIKQMKNTKSKEFFAELSILCKVHHNNLIELIGYSAGAESLFLVYEFASNGALSDHLHNHVAKGQKPLSWIMRVRIALDAAKGLEYIHGHIKPFCIHRDVKTSNILLDSSFRAKIADFGLVKLLEYSPEVGAATSKIVGTFGYLAPEYIREGCVTPKSDVYAYGVVLMELITGQPALSRSQSVGSDQYVEHQSLVNVMLSALEDSLDTMAKLAEIMDPSLTHYHKDSLLQMALLSKSCVDDDWQRRPGMSEVVLRLSKIARFVKHGELEGVIHPTN